MEDGGKSLDLDLFGVSDDLDAISSRRPVGGARRAKFQPKFKGKIEAEPSMEPAPLPPPSLLVKKELKVEEDEVIMVKAEEPPPQDPSSAVLSDSVDAAVEPDSDHMEVDDNEVEDTVVREIDVLFTPSPLAEDSWLYVMQYPLRPSWRPYELNESCEEVRVKPKQSKMEVVLSMDVDSENYDPDFADNIRIEKQTLSSSEAPFLTDYAVGIMLGNDLHLNPVHAVVQLHPSISHDGELQKRKHNTQKQEVNTKSSEEKREDALKQSSRPQGSQVPLDSKENLDDTEPWVSLEYHATDSHFSGLYQQKMMNKEDNHIGFTMKLSDYINSLCPNDKIVKVKNRRVLLSMPLEERLKKWLTEVQINRFTALKYLAPSRSDEDVLEVLTRYADLVQGLWVSKSSLLLYEGRDARVRDYILNLFNENHTISKDKLKGLKIFNDSLRDILKPLAVERPKLNDWKFREPIDNSFKKQYPKIVEEQERAWSSRENDFMDLKCGPVMMKNSQNPILARRATASGRVDLSKSRSKDGAGSSTSTTMSNEAREALPKALLKLFQVQKIHSLKSITREIRERAEKSSLLKEDQETRIFVNAANGVSDDSLELKSLIGQLAVDIHGVYVLKSIGNPALDQLRNVVIGLFLKKKPNSKLGKDEIVQAAKSLKRDISGSEYNQVLNELCSNIKGAWVIKSVD